MKQHRLKNYLPLGLFLLCLVLGACSQTDPQLPDQSEPLRLSSQKAIYNKLGGEITITVTSGAPWQAKIIGTADWLQVRSEGEKGLVLTADNNATNASREAQVDVVSGKETLSITVLQTAEEGLLKVNTDHLLFKGETREKVVKVETSDPSWTFQMSEAAEWCKVTPRRERGELLVAVDPITPSSDPNTVNSRSVLLAIKLQDEYRTVLVEQRDRDIFVLPYTGTDKSVSSIKKYEEERGHKLVEQDDAKGLLRFETDALHVREIVYRYDRYEPDIEKRELQVATINGDKELMGESFQAYMRGEHYEVLLPTKHDLKNQDASIKFWKYVGRQHLSFSAEELPGRKNNAKVDLYNFSSYANENNWQILPTRRVGIFKDPTFKVAQIDDYERAEGLAFKDSQKGELPENKQLDRIRQYVPTNLSDNPTPGTHIATNYFMMLPGEDQVPTDLPKNLIGTVDSRLDIYTYTSPKPFKKLGSKLILDHRFLEIIKRAGFRIGNINDQGFQAFLFTRGKEILTIRNLDDKHFIIQLEEGELIFEDNDN